MARCSERTVHIQGALHPIFNFIGSLLSSERQIHSQGLPASVAFELQNAAASINLFIELVSAIRAETPTFKVVFQSVFHAIQPPIKKATNGKAHRWSEHSDTSCGMPEAAVIRPDAVPFP